MPSVSAGPSVAQNQSVVGGPGVVIGPSVEGSGGFTYPLNSMASAIYDFANQRYYTRSAALNSPFVSAPFASLFTYTGQNGTRVNPSGLIEAAVTNQPRFDYDPVTLAAKGILIEEARTNLLLRSSEFDNVAWSDVVGGTSTRINTTAPFLSGNTAGLVTLTSANGGIRQVVSGLSAAAHAFSFYVEGVTFSNTLLISLESGAASYGTACSVNLNLTTGVFTGLAGFTSTSATALGSGWLVKIILPVAGGTFEAKIQIKLATIGESFRLAIPQFEAGAFPTSYIPTTSAAVTRTADVCTRTLGAEFNASEGTVYSEYVEIVPSNGQLGNVFDISPNGPQYFIGSTGLQLIKNRVDNVQESFGTQSALGMYKAATFWQNLTQFGGSFNGGAIATGTQTTAATMTALNVGNGGLPLNRPIKKIIYYPSRLSNAQLQAITT